jgi:hypothetical protein
MERITDVLCANNYYSTLVMTITEKLSHLKAINIKTLFDDVLKENEETILDMNRSQMYDEGVMNINNPGTVEHYSPATIKNKKRAPFNKTEFITLKWMGNFHKALKLIIFKDTFLISSDNRIWANFLEPQDRFESALGMTEKSKGELRELSRDELIKKIKSEL